jgi:glycerol-3-phosphate dehydrogenase subunit B
MADDRERCDLAVIGTGMAGMAAALFAVRRGLDTLQVGIAGAMDFASGLIDLCGVHPVGSGAVVEDPWEAIARLSESEPLHPYARLEPDAIRSAMDEVLALLDAGGLAYYRDPLRNQTAITPVGTLKPTYAVPRSMRPGIEALAQRRPGLLVDFAGLKGFSARQIAAALAPRWPGLETARLPFPGERGELYPERIARALEAAPVRAELAAGIGPLLGRAAAVGLPAVLGVSRTALVCADLERRLGVPVFEIPTMLPAVAGLRLRETFEQALPPLGLRPLMHHRVWRARRRADGDWELEAGREGIERTIQARAVLLASGRFLGQGLHADREGIRETIFDLPVKQPPDRSGWHDKRLFAPGGHPVNRAGLAVDRRFSPLDPRGAPVYDNLFAAGAILADQDWMRQKCGSGLAIATAFGAVRAAAERLGRTAG